MRNLFLRLTSLFIILNLLFYSIYPAAVVLAQDEYFQEDESGGEDQGGEDEGGGDEGSGDYSADYSDWDSYSYDIPEAETQEPFDAVYPEQGRGAQDGPEIPQESFDFAQDQQPPISTQGGPFKAPGLSYILPPEQETPASEALEAEQQQQVAYYDDLLTSEEQNELTTQARVDYQEWIEEQPVVDEQTQDNALSSYFQSAAEVADREDQEYARERGLPDAEAQSVIHTLVSTLEKGQDVPDEFWQDYGSKLGDLSDGAADLVTSQVREAQERGEQKKAEEAIEEAERRTEQDEKEYTEGLAQWKNASPEEKAQIIRDAVGIPPEVPDDKVLSYSYGPLIETGAVKVEGDLDNFNLTTTNDLLPADESRILSAEKREEIIQKLTEKPLETITNLAGLFDTADLKSKISDLQEKMNDVNQRLQDQNLTELNRYSLNKEFIGLADKLIELNQDIAVSTAMYLPTRNEALTRESLGIPDFKSSLRDNSPIWISALMDLTRPYNPEGFYEDRIIEKVGRIDIEEVRNIYPEITEKARELSTSIFGGTDKVSEMLISEWLLDGIDPEKILERFSEANGVFDYLNSTNGKLTPSSPEKLLEDWKVYKINSRGISFPTFNYSPTPALKGKVDNWWKLDVIDSLLRQEKDFKNSVVAQRTDDFRSYLENLADLAIAKGADPKIKDNLDKIIDPKAIHFVPEIPGGGVGQTTASLGSDYAGTTIVGNSIYTQDNSILIEKEYASEFMLPAHEMIHRAAGLNNNELAHGNWPYLNVETFANLNEGITHWATLKGMASINEEVKYKKTYSQQVELVDKVIDNMVSSANIPHEQAEGIVLEAAFLGDYSKLIQIVGKENIEELMKNNVVYPDFKIVVILTADKMIINPVSKALGFGKEKNLQNQQLPRNPFAKEVFAQEAGVENESLAFDLLVKKELAKRTLQETGRLPSAYVDELLKTDILTPEVRNTYRGFWMTTGGNGVVEAEVKNGSYKVGVDEIPDVDIKIPSFVEVKAGTTIVPIGIKEGNGKVEKVAGIRNIGGPFDVYAQDKSFDGGQSPELSKVQVAAFYDENGNGNWDGSEKALPWAGIQVSLTKVNQEKTVSMLPGWNLITLTALPTQPLTASSLLGQIAKQGGYATTVSKLEGGSWKSYVVRGDNNFSGEDFPIEPGQAYFVKNLKRTLLTFEGQEFATPVKVNLEDGWNAVGFPKTAGPYTVSTLIDELNTQAAGADAASRWESGLWDSFVKSFDSAQDKSEEYGENFAIEPNRGYIVRLKKGVELTP